MFYFFDKKKEVLRFRGLERLSYFYLVLEVGFGVVFWISRLMVFFVILRKFNVILEKVERDFFIIFLIDRNDKVLIKFSCGRYYS